jgi:hypothetical protein
MMIRELKGYKSLRAFNAFHALILGLKMLPQYLGDSYADFYSALAEKSAEDQRKILREAACFVELQKDEVEALLSFVEDANGIAYGSANIGNLRPDEIVEMIVEVCMKMASFKIDMVSEAEKKN